MRGRARLLLGLGLAAAAPAPAAGASCCGGASALHPFVLPKWESALVGGRLAVSAELDRRDGAGDRLDGTMRAVEPRLLVGGAWRVGRDWQLGGSLPLVMRQVAVPGNRDLGYGVGDMALSLRYEWIDEETCVVRPFRELAWDELKPTIHIVLGLGLPTGRPLGWGDDPLGARVTGTGDLEQTLGIEATKIWGAIGNSLEGGGGRRWPLRRDGDAIWLAHASASVMWYPAYKRFLGISAGWKGERGGLVVTDALRVEAIGSIVFLESRWWLRGNLGLDGLAGRSVPWGPTGGVTLVRLL